jgi:hypothetical protein
LVIRANRLFLPKHIEGYIDALKELVYDRDYLAILIVIGGHIGGLEINSRTEENGHLYLVKDDIEFFFKDQGCFRELQYIPFLMCTKYTFICEN